MVGIDHIRTFGAEQPVAQGRRRKAGVVEHTSDSALVMTWIQRHPRHLYSVDKLALQQLELVAGVDLAARIVGKAGDNLDLEALSDQLAGKHQALEGRLGIEPLGQQEYAGSHAAQYLFQTVRIT
ncbi:hypothetical protein D3C85_1410090 [compost metagenome]